MKQGNTLHFINRVDKMNMGDFYVTPLLYYWDFFKDYKIKRHDIRFIDFDSINDGDVVILGGGGLFDYSEAGNRAINRVLELCSNVIAWSPGLNNSNSDIDIINTKIRYEKFKIITLRDYVNKYDIPFLPDITCKMEYFKNKYTKIRKIGIAQHKDYPITDFNYEKISNKDSLDEILKFIGETEIIISNSFHMIYWSMLMGNKTICIDPFSEKFYSYKYKPEYAFSERDDIDGIINNAKVYDFKDEFISLTDEFFLKVKKVVEQALQKETHSIFDIVTNACISTNEYKESQLNIGDMFSSCLYELQENSFSDDNKQIRTNNVFGDEIHRVFFKLPRDYEPYHLRFDPIKGHHVEVSIVSAKDGGGTFCSRLNWLYQSKDGTVFLKQMLLIL